MSPSSGSVLNETARDNAITHSEPIAKYSVIASIGSNRLLAGIHEHL
jgi:hypothetical protein